MQKIRAILSWLLSFRKTNWTIDDYPIRLRKQVVEPMEQHGRFKPVIWNTQIINWWQMSGSGDTEGEAITNLKENFERYRETHGRLPRPGTGAPLEYSSTSTQSGLICRKSVFGCNAEKKRLCHSDLLVCKTLDLDNANCIYFE